MVAAGVRGYDLSVLLDPTTQDTTASAVDGNAIVTSSVRAGAAARQTAFATMVAGGSPTDRRRLP